MLKHVKVLFYAFVASALIIGCAGEDGDPGPQGDKGDTGAEGPQGDPGQDAAIKVGHMTGTIQGVRRDGTAFDEDFNFEFVYGSESLGTDGYVMFKRFGTSGEAIANAANTNAPADNVVRMGGYVDGGFEPESFELGFTKELSSLRLFRLASKAYTSPFNYRDLLLVLSVEQNARYGFDYGVNAINYYEADYDGDRTNENIFTVNQGLNWMSVGYNMTTGELEYVALNDVEILTEGEIFDQYNALKFVMNDDLRSYVFIRASDRAPLHEVVGVVPADNIEITNYTSLNGVISFDFTINISKYRGVLGEVTMGFQVHGKNTTGHDLSISGHFTSGQKVYSSVVGRVNSGE